MFPLLPLAVGATVAGIGFAVGKNLADTILIPWTTDAADRLRQSWDNSAEERRQRQLDEIDPAPKKAPRKKASKRSSKRSSPKSAG